MKNSVKCHFKPDVDNIKEIAMGNVGGQCSRRRGQTEQRSQRRSKVLVKGPKPGETSEVCIWKAHWQWDHSSALWEDAGGR